MTPAQRAANFLALLALGFGVMILAFVLLVAGTMASNVIQEIRTSEVNNNIEGN